MFNIDTIRNVMFNELGDNVQLYLTDQGILVSKKVLGRVNDYLIDHKRDRYLVGMLRPHYDRKMVEQNMDEVIKQIKAQM
jgi:hypothetical protein